MKLCKMFKLVFGIFNECQKLDLGYYNCFCKMKLLLVIKLLYVLELLKLILVLIDVVCNFVIVIGNVE